MKFERDYFKSYSDTLTKQLEDSRTVIESLESENAIYDSNRATMQGIINEERSYNILTNEELKDLEKKYKKRGWTIVGVGSGGLLLFAGTLYVTLGPHTRN